jgi:hypothetical protein
VWADRKRQVSVSIAMDIEAVGVGEIPFVSVSRTDIRQHVRTAMDDRVVQLDVLRRGLEDQVDWRLIAQRFFNHFRSERVLSSHLSKGIGIVEERDQRVANEMRGRLGTTEVGEDDQAEYFE